jgi:hypothetical protein
MAKKAKKKSGPKRLDRRFVAHSAQNPWLVRVLGIIGAMALGAGVYGYFYGESFKKAAEAARAANEMPAQDALRMEAVPLYVVAFAAVILGITIWLGTSSEAPIRVGAPGIGMERGELRRMPWWSISQITWQGGNAALAIVGKDEAGTPWSFRVSSKAHPEAVGWILKESLDRVPKVVDIPDSIIENLPGAGIHAGQLVELEPLQVVGKKDAITGKLISYEPDARVCARCERVYFKRSVPKRCKCGASLADLRGGIIQDELEGEDDEEDEIAEHEEPAAESEKTDGA